MFRKRTGARDILAHTPVGRVAAGGRLALRRGARAGEQVVSGELTFGDLAEKLRVRAQPVLFDQRPGALEATRGMPCNVAHVVGARLSAPEGKPWGVKLLVRGADGVEAEAVLDPVRAEALAAELVKMAALVSGVWDPTGPNAALLEGGS